MCEFVPCRCTYNVGAPEHDNLRGRPVVVVPIRSVMPLHGRVLEHGMFRGREEVVQILHGFKEGSAIPPVLVVPLRPEAGFSHRLFSGAHRFYCALAAGYTHIPAIEVAAVLPRTRTRFDAA